MLDEPHHHFAARGPEDPFSDGLLAALAQAPYRVRHHVSPSRPSPAPVAPPTKKPAPKPAPPARTPAPAATPTKSTDQARAGAKARSSAPTSTSTRRTTPRPAPAPAPAPKPKPTPSPASADAAERNARTTRAKAAQTDTRRAAAKGGSATPSKSTTSPMSADAAERTVQARRAELQRTDRMRSAAKAGSATPSTSTSANEPGSSRPMTPADEQAEIRRLRNRTETQRAQERTNAAALDRLTPAERQAAETAQAELERQERELLDGVPETPTTRAGAPVNRAMVEEQRAVERAARERAEAEIAELRESYVEEHEYWVEGDTVYAASVDDGELVLERDSHQPAQGETPELQVEQVVRLATDRSRTDVVTSRSVPRSPEEPRQTHTSTVRTDPAGKPVSSQLKLEQERRLEDGSVERSRNEENYRPGQGEPPWIATNRVQEQSRTSADGEDVVTDRVTTTYAEDGQTRTRVLNEHEERHGRAESFRGVDTSYAADGATPTRQVVEDSGVDADGNALLATRAETEYDGEGEPATTYITRDGTLPEGTTASEFVVWGEGSTVTDRITGGPDTDRRDFEAFLEDGTRPPAAELPAEPRVREYGEWLESLSQADRDRIYEEYGYSYGEQAAYAAYAEEFEEETLPAWEAERDRVNALNEQNTLREVDPDRIVGHEDAIEWTRQGNNRFEGEALNGNLVEPLQPGSATPSAFDVPAQLQARANAEAIDRSRYATDPAAFRELDRAQATFEQQLEAASTDAERERLMRSYFADNDYWIDRGGQPGDEPVLLASGWSTGAPSSEIFGASRAADPHAVMARTGIQGQDDMGQPATIDVLQRMYVDGSQDDIVRTSYDGPAGAERTTVVGEHTNANDVVTERDSHAETMAARTDQGLEPLAVTEISRERFNPTTGLPLGEQYFAVAQSDSTMTSLEERRDNYGTDGIIFDTQVESTSMSRNFDEDLTEGFLDANAAVIAMARNDEFNPNDDGTTVTTPPAGSYWSHSSTDIDYDDEGVAINQVVEDESITVADAADDNNNGVVVTETNSRRQAGSEGGTTPIFGEDGSTLVVPEHVETTLRTTEYDPDAGTAGGNRSTGHQFREITSVTMSSTRNPDGTVANQSVSPITTQTLREGHDDDWIFDEKQLETRPTDDGSFDVVTDDDDNPVTIGDGIHREDLDHADKFEEFMEGWGGRIVGGLAIVAGIAGAVFTGGASLALTAVGVGLATTSFAYTALNYSQGEASGWDLALSGAGVVLAGLPAITGVRQLVGASRGTRAFNAARAAGATDDVARSIADDVLRSSTQQGRVATNTLRVGNTADNAMDANDGVDATRAALQGDFWGAGMMLFAIGGGAAAGRGRAALNARRAPGAADGGTPDTPATPPSGANGTPGTPGTPTAPGTPDPTHAGAPALPTGASPADPLRGGGPAAPASSSQPLPGTSTGPTTPAAPADAPVAQGSDVAGARGEGTSAGPITPVEVEGSLYQRLLAESGWDGFARVDGRSPDIAMNGGTPLTPDQQAAVGHQTGLPHTAINPALRDGTTSGAVWGPDYDLATHVANTDAAIDGSTFAEAGTLYRGMRMDDAAFQQLLETGRFSDAAYLSTSRNPRVASGFQSVVGDGRRVVFAIDVAPGQRGLDVDAISTERNEMETLLPRNSQLEVVDVTINADGDAIVHARLAEPSVSDPRGADVAGMDFDLDVPVILTPSGPRIVTATRRSEALPEVTYGKNEQKKFSRHVDAIAPELAGRNWNASTRAEFRTAIDGIVSSAQGGDGVVIEGTYQGQSALFAYRSSTNQLVMLRPNGEFWSGWNPNPGQIDGLTQFGTLGEAQPALDFDAMLENAANPSRAGAGLVEYIARNGHRYTGLEGTAFDGVPNAAPGIAELDAAGALAPTPQFGRETTRAGRPPLEPPLPRNSEIVGNVRPTNPAAAAAAANHLHGAIGSGPGAPIVRGIGPDGRMIVDQPLHRPSSIDSLIASNPEVVGRLGGPDAVRANPGLLTGLELNVRRSDGRVQPGWRAEGVVGGRVLMTGAERSSMDLGEVIVRRQQADPNFDGRAALRDVIAADPSILGNRPLRLRRSDSSISQGRAAHNIDDGWQAVSSRVGPDGQVLFELAKRYHMSSFSPDQQARYIARGHGPNDVLTMTRLDVPLDQVLDYNRARLEGDHGQLPTLDVRHERPDGPAIGTNRNLLDGPATARADQAVVHTQAALDYLYSRYGYVPTGGNIRLVIDAEGAFKNASMRSADNVLSIGVHPGGGAAFDPSVIMHELGHKMVDDFTAGNYSNNHPSGAIHEGFADVAAAAWTHDPIVGRVFDQSTDTAIRDIRTGERLLGTRQEWDAANQAADGAGAHRGSGVVTGVASRLVPEIDPTTGYPVNPREGDMTWGEVGDLYNDALRSGALRTEMDFDAFSDGLRIAATRRYGLDSPRYRRVVESLGQGGLAPTLQQGRSVSRITSRGTIEHGFQVMAVNADYTVLVADAHGRRGRIPLDRVLAGGGRHVELDAGGSVVDVPARRSPASGGYSHAVEPTSATAAPAGASSATGGWRPTFDHGAGGVDATPRRPTLLRRIANHLTITDTATAVSVTAVHTQQLLDRERRLREARLQAQLHELQQLQQFSERVEG